MHVPGDLERGGHCATMPTGHASAQHVARACERCRGTVVRVRRTWHAQVQSWSLTVVVSALITLKTINTSVCAAARERDGRVQPDRVCRVSGTESAVASHKGRIKRRRGDGKRWQ